MNISNLFVHGKIILLKSILLEKNDKIVKI